MTTIKTKTVVLSIAVMIILAGVFVLTRKKPEPKTPSEEVAAAIGEISKANVGLPAPQIDAKALIMTAMIQKRIPSATNWCETLNVGNKLWPVTPTNTVFALNPKMAGQVYRKGIRGDSVVFFEASNPGWNLVGGPELLAQKSDGVTVAFMNGRSLVVQPGEIAGLRWDP